MIFGSLIPISSVVFLISLISSYGTFCVHLKSSIISTVVSPTTEIIEPFLECFFVYVLKIIFPVIFI